MSSTHLLHNFGVSIQKRTQCLQHSFVKISLLFGMCRNNNSIDRYAVKPRNRRNFKAGALSRHVRFG